MEGKKDPTLPEDSQAGAAPETPTANGTQVSPAGSPSAKEGLQAVVDKLIAEKTELTDLLLRKQAEMENFRKRTQREREELIQHAAADLIHALLPTLDAFDRALAHRNEGASEQFYQGLELIRKELMDVLGRAGLAALESVGQIFDPHFHQAVEMVEAGEHRDQEIVEELQRGYKLKKRLLRPAVVKVAVAKLRAENADERD